MERVRAVQFWGVTRCKGAEKVHEYVKRFKVVDLESPNLRTSLSIDVSLHYFLFVAYAARFLFFFVVQYIAVCLPITYRLIADLYLQHENHVLQDMNLKFMYYKSFIFIIIFI